MDEIAKALKVSRASLYLLFKNKDGVFGDLSTLLQSDAHDEAKKYINGDLNASSLSDRIEGALLARPFQKAVVESKHGAKRRNEHHQLCGDIEASYRDQFQKRLTSALREGVKRGEINLKSANLSASNIAKLLNLAVASLRQGTVDGTPFEKRVHHFIRLTMAGIQPDRGAARLKTPHKPSLTNAQRLLKNDTGQRISNRQKKTASYLNMRGNWLFFRERFYLWRRR
jgi:AcrR family transcriptional regulator